jgi:hypothetical protein
MEGQIVESNSISHCQTGNDAQNSSVEPEEHVPHSPTSTSATKKVCHTVGEAQLSDDDAHAAFFTPLASPDGALARRKVCSPPTGEIRRDAKTVG